MKNSNKRYSLLRKWPEKNSKKRSSLLKTSPKKNSKKRGHRPLKTSQKKKSMRKRALNHALSRNNHLSNSLNLSVK